VGKAIHGLFPRGSQRETLSIRQKILDGLPKTHCKGK